MAAIFAYSVSRLYLIMIPELDKSGYSAEVLVLCCIGIVLALLLVGALSVLGTILSSPGVVAVAAAATYVPSPGPLSRH